MNIGSLVKGISDFVLVIADVGLVIFLIVNDDSRFQHDQMCKMVVDGTCESSIRAGCMSQATA